MKVQVNIETYLNFETEDCDLIQCLIDEMSVDEIISHAITENEPISVSISEV